MPYLTTLGRERGPQAWRLQAARRPSCRPEGLRYHENLVFDELLADRKYQFLYGFVPVPIKGATGSPGCPIAIT